MLWKNQRAIIEKWITADIRIFVVCAFLKGICCAVSFIHGMQAFSVHSSSFYSIENMNNVLCCLWKLANWVIECAVLIGCINVTNGAHKRRSDGINHLYFYSSSSSVAGHNLSVYILFISFGLIGRFFSSNTLMLDGLQHKRTTNVNVSLHEITQDIMQYAIDYINWCHKTSSCCDRGKYISMKHMTHIRFDIFANIVMIDGTQWTQQRRR